MSSCETPTVTAEEFEYPAAGYLGDRALTAFQIYAAPSQAVAPTEGIPTSTPTEFTTNPTPDYPYTTTDHDSRGD